MEMKFKPGDKVRPIKYKYEDSLCISEDIWDELRKFGGTVVESAHDTSTGEEMTAVIENYDIPYRFIFYARCLEKIEEQDEYVPKLGDKVVVKYKFGTVDNCYIDKNNWKYLQRVGGKLVRIESDRVEVRTRADFKHGFCGWRLPADYITLKTPWYKKIFRRKSK